ncbi:MAG: hypothetical protein NPIRA06_08530 [Nitrospirales bacterium]|nr:MAG: hypothetical protein NPIRA06_08530 [Nitrospirales bacterium]
MIFKRRVKMHIGLWLAFLLGLYGCGGGNPKVQLSLKDVVQLKSASHVYIVDYPSPEFAWWIMPYSLPFTGVVNLNLEKVEKWLELPFPLEIIDPTHTLRNQIMATLEDKYHFTNLALPQGVSLNENLMDLRKNLSEGKVIDIQTYFWKLVPTGSENGDFLPPKKCRINFNTQGISGLLTLTARMSSTSIYVITHRKWQYMGKGYDRKSTAHFLWLSLLG